MSIGMTKLIAAVKTPDWVVLDTETTGLDVSAEIVQIGIVNSEGNTVFESLVRPTSSISPDAQRVHGISDADVVEAPPITDLLPAIIEAIAGRTVIVYNAEFDVRMLQQSTEAHNVEVDWSDIPASWQCAMKAYAEYRGERNNRGGFRWHSLENACRQQGLTIRNTHNAIGDCLLTLALVKKITG